MSTINSVLSVMALYDRPCTKGELVMHIARKSNVCNQDMEQLKNDISLSLLDSVRYGYIQKKDREYSLMPLGRVTKCQRDLEAQPSVENALSLGRYFNWSNANNAAGDTLLQMQEQPTPQPLPNLIDVQKRDRTQPAKKGTGGQALKKPGTRFKTRQATHKAKLRTKAAVKKTKAKLKTKKTIKRGPGAKKQKNGRLSQKQGKR